MVGQTVQSHSTMPCVQKSLSLGLVSSSERTFSSITPSKKHAFQDNLLSAFLFVLSNTLLAPGEQEGNLVHLYIPVT